MNDVSKIIPVKFAILIDINFLKLPLKKLLIPIDGAIQKTSNKLGIVDLSTIIEIHGPKYLINIIRVKINADLFSKVIKTDHDLVF